MRVSLLIIASEWWGLNFATVVPVVPEWKQALFLCQATGTGVKGEMTCDASSDVNSNFLDKKKKKGRCGEKWDGALRCGPPEPHGTFFNPWWISHSLENLRQSHTYIKTRKIREQFQGDYGLHSPQVKKIFAGLSKCSPVPSGSTLIQKLGYMDDT